MSSSRISISPYDALLFDFDGTLVDSEPLHWQVWREVLAPLGVDLGWELYAEICIGVADLPMLETMAMRIEPRVPLAELVAVYPRKKKLFRERVLAAPPMCEETRRFLEELRGHRMGVVTSSTRPEVEVVLEEFLVSDCFEIMICADDVRRRKPHPEPYLLAASTMNVRRPLVIEDSAAGIVSGRAAGFDVVEVTSAAKMPELVRRHLRTFR